MKTLTIDCSFDTELQLNTFVNILAWMEMCGNVGHCTDFHVRLDGDGGARPKFTFANAEIQNSFQELKNDLVKELDKPIINNFDAKFVIE